MFSTSIKHVKKYNSLEKARKDMETLERNSQYVCDLFFKVIEVGEVQEEISLPPKIKLNFITIGSLAPIGSLSLTKSIFSLTPREAKSS